MICISILIAFKTALALDTEKTRRVHITEFYIIGILLKNLIFYIVLN